MDRRRVGLIGAGTRGVVLMRDMLSHGGFEIAAAADPDPERRESLRRAVPGDYPVSANWEELLDNPEVDLVVIASPDFAHEEQAVAAFESGRDVFLEKPIAITVDGGRRVLRARDRAGRMLLIGFVLRYAPIFRRARKLVEEGAIGRPTTAWVLHSVASGGPWYFHDWHSTFANTGGLLLQKGSHDFDLINWFAGSTPRSVYALGSREFFGGDRPDELRCAECPEAAGCSEFMDDPRALCAFRNEIDVLDDHLVLIEYDNGFKASYQECHYAPEDNREYIFIGTGGKLTVDMLHDRILLRRRGSRGDPEILGGHGAGDCGHGGGDAGIIAELADCLRTGRAPSAGGEAGLEAVRLGLAAHESIRTGRPVPLTPAS